MLSILLTALFGLVVYFLIKVKLFYLRVCHYPPGPSPLPFIGNGISIYKWSQEEAFYLAAQKLSEDGDPTTLWFGSTPFVIVNDYKNFREASIGAKRNHFAGRLQLSVGTLQKRGNEDIVFGKYGPEWEALRKVAHLAVRKYSVSEALENLVTEVLDDMLDGVDPERAFNLDEGILEAMHNIIALCVFGHKYDPDSKELKTIKRINAEMKNHIGKVLLIDFVPPLRFIFKKHVEKAGELFDQFIALEMGLYRQARESYQEGQIRHFTDAIVAAKFEAENEAKSVAKYLTEGNLTQIIYDIFGAATPTTSQTFKWLIYFVFSDPEVLSKCRKELENVVGDRRPSAADRKDAKYIDACILEVLRIRPASPFSLPHLTTCDTTLSTRGIPKDAPVLFNLYSVNHDPELWEDHEFFKPERFLDEAGELKKDILAQMSTFGVGARACIGEKMAMTVIFVMFTRLLQRCEDIRALGGRFDLFPKKGFFNCEPKPHEVFITTRRV